MAEPWEKYKAAGAGGAEAGPWAKYGRAKSAPAATGSTLAARKDQPSQFEEFVGTLGSDIAAAPAGLWQLIRHPINTFGTMAAAQGGQFSKAGEAYRKGEYGEALERGLAGATPLLGPAYEEQIRPEIERKQYGRAAAHLAEFSPAPEYAVRGVTGPVKRLLKPTAKKIGRSVYEAELRPGTRPSLAQRTEMVERGLTGKAVEVPPVKPLPIEQKSLPKLEAEITANKARISEITKDPASPYSARTVPIADLLIPVDKWINRVRRVDVRAANALQRARETWAKSLGYVAPTTAVPPGAPTQVATSILDASGKPVMRTVPGKPGRPATPGVSDVSIADAQRLKEDLYAIINSTAYAETAEPGTMVAGRKLAARGIKRGIEQAIPEEPVKAINHAIEVDIRLKDAINVAIKRHPSWINDWAVFVLGAGVGETVGGHIGGGAAAIGALTRMAARNPRIMSRLAIALDRSGVPLPSPGLRTAGARIAGTQAQRQAERQTGGEPEEEPKP